jgi:UDP-N-acetylmuramoyl-L-alanyl-D-glutamate--2,6-diaminopimelate ligase
MSEPRKSLRQLLQSIREFELHGSGDVEIASIVFDSRHARRGSLFIAIPGFKSDGLEFASDAISRGAVALVAEKSPSVDLTVPIAKVPDARRALAELSWAFFDHPEQALIPIAVTGTNGKTTVASLIADVLNRCKQTCGLIGTLGIHSGAEKIETSRTTPESADLAEYFHAMLRSRCSHVVMEATSIGIDLKRIWGIPFRVAVFTNLTRDHIDYHGTLEAYRDAKLRLFEGLDKKSTSVINLDDPASHYFLSAARGKVLSYSLDRRGDFHVLSLDLKRDSSNFQVQTPTGILDVSAPLIGRFNVSNVLAVMATTYALGIPGGSVAEALLTVSPIRGRAEIVPSGAPFTVVIDYAHTPDALAKILETLSSLERRRILTVIGAGGDRDRGKRPQMAAIAFKLSDELFLTNDNPRSENPDAILDDMAAGIAQGSSFYRDPDRRKAIHESLARASDGDIVLIAGKGHETYQEIAGVKYPFDDRQVALDWLANAGFSR